jgi:hypothetical protein
VSCPVTRPVTSRTTAAIKEFTSSKAGISGWQST